MKAQEIKTLDDVRKFLARIPNLHNGGCGVSAIAMYRWLKKYTHNPRVRFVLCYKAGSEVFFRRNSRFLSSDKDSYPTACSHAGIYYDDPATMQTAPIDARGYLPITNYEYTQVFRRAHPMIAMVKEKGEWYDAFNRDKYIPIIEKRLGINLKDIL
jgi:hypothetical protein